MLTNTPVTTRSVIWQYFRSSQLILGLLTVLFFAVLTGFYFFLLRVLGLGVPGSILLLGTFVFGMAIGNLLLSKLEPRVSRFKLTLACIALAIVLILTGLRSTIRTSPLELAFYLALSGLGFGAGLSKLGFNSWAVSRWWLVSLGILSILISGMALTIMIQSDFAPRANKISTVLSSDERAQLEVLKPQATLAGFNPVKLKTQLKTSLTLQLENLDLALSKNQQAAKQSLLENPATPSAWRAMLQRGGLKAVTEQHFLKQKINLEKALRDEDPKAIQDLLSNNEIPAWVRSDLARGGLKDWVHRQFDVQRLLIEHAIQNSDQQAIKALVQNPQTRPELRALLEQGGVRTNIRTQLTNLRLALKKAIQTGDLAAISLVYQHPMTPKSIREIFKDGALQPQTKLEIAAQQNLIVQGFLKADPQAIKQLKSLGIATKPNLPADFTVPPQPTESRAQRAIKELLEQASLIRRGFLTRRTLFHRALQNGDLNAIKSLCPDCKPAPTPSQTTKPVTPTTSNPTTQTKSLERSELPETLKVYLKRGGLRAQIGAKYTTQYQILSKAVNSGDITQVIALLENPTMPVEIGTWITKLNLKDVETPETQAESLKKVKSILDGLQQTETRNAVLAALEAVNQNLTTLEITELESKIDNQVVTETLNEALPKFDAAASKIETRAIDVALQGALIALTVNEKAAGNLAVQTLIDRAQTQLAQKAPKTINAILKSTLKTARGNVQTMQRKLEHVIDALVLAEKEAFVEAIRKSFGILAIFMLLVAGLSYTHSRQHKQTREKSVVI
jgi:hypothetical protein